MPQHHRDGGLGRTISSGFRLVSAFKACSLCWACCWKRRAVVVKARVAILEAIAAVVEWMTAGVGLREGGWSMWGGLGSACWCSRSFRMDSTCK